MITGIAVHFIGAALSYADPVWDHRPRNRSVIPATGYGPASAQIQAYSDRMTRFSRTSSNRACPASNIQKNAGAKQG